MDTLKGVCPNPNCRREIIIPRSCVLYTCVCGKMYNIRIIKDVSEIPKQPIPKVEPNIEDDEDNY